LNEFQLWFLLHTLFRFASSALIRGCDLFTAKIMNKVRIGPAGWSYKDWEGVVYPQKPGPKFDPLTYLSRFFDTIEINSSFYRPPAATSAKAWARRVANNPAFKFTAKLHRVFTHERGKATSDDEETFRKGIDPLAEAGKFGALLLQFPWSFKNTEEERAYMLKLVSRFKDYPLIVEVRHASWNNPVIYEELETRDVGICNIDQPIFKKSIRPSALTTSPLAYVRLHGRNYQNWFREEAVRDERYDYLYSADELEPWIVRIKEVAKQVKETYVITNNHFLGKAAVNALEIKSTLEERRVPAPLPLFEKYPRLADSATPESAPPDSSEPTLFS
ncbi:MAG: DUF72 domain-containing protein, partial [Terriglobia bacterium]